MSSFLTADELKAKHPQLEREYVLIYEELKDLEFAPNLPSALFKVSK